MAHSVAFGILLVDHLEGWKSQVKAEGCQLVVIPTVRLVPLLSVTLEINQVEDLPFSKFIKLHKN